MSQENERRARELLPTLNTAPRVAAAFEPDVRRLAAALDEAEARGRPQWRPVSERPECGVGLYLVWSPDFVDGVEPMQWSGSEWLAEYGVAVINVTHWMPLPPPPSEER